MFLSLKSNIYHRITGKEDIIEQYEEESEDFREKNYKIKLEVVFFVFVYSSNLYKCFFLPE